MSGASNPRQPGMPEGVTPIRARGQGGMLLVPWQSGMDSGSGYDTVTRTVLSSAAPDRGTLTSHGARDGVQGQYVQERVLQIESIEKMREVLQLGTELDFGYDAFSANSVGNFLKTTQFDSYNLYFMVLCFVQSTEFRVAGFEIAPRFDTDRYDDNKFRAGFGDYFVSGWVTGGYLIGLAEIKATSQQALTEIKAEIGGGYKSGPLTASGKFASNWQRWSARTDLTSRIEVIYAGMEGSAIKSVAQSAGRPTPPPGPAGGTGSGPPAPIAPIVLANRVPIRQEDDDDGDEDEEFLVDDESEAAPVPVPVSGGGGAAPPRGKPIEQLDPRLQNNDPLDYHKVEVTIEGLVKAAADLPLHTPRHGVPLYAILESYSPKYRQFGELSIDRAEYERKRDLLNEVYLKARVVANAVAYAKATSSQFTVSVQELTAIQARMDKLMTACDAAWRRLKADASYELPATIKLPADAEIPGWAVQKAAFSPFLKPPNPGLFCKLFEEAIDAAIIHPNKAARKALRSHLDLVMEKSLQNYVNARDAMTAMALTFGAVDDDIAARAETLADLAEAIGSSKESWSTASAEIEASCHALGGAPGLDDSALAFLKWVNPLLFGPDKDADKQQYGFAAFWIALHAALTDLAEKSRQWGTATRFSDVVTTGGSKAWSDRATLFKTQITAMGSRVQIKLQKV